METVTFGFSVEPMGEHYRIVMKGNDYRPIIFSDDSLTLEQMERICYQFQTRAEDWYKEGWSDGYAQGYEDGLKIKY